MSPRSTRRARAVSALMCVGLVLAGCGGDDSGSDETTATTAAASETSAAGTDTTVSADTTAASTDSTDAPVDADTTRRLRMIGTNGVQQMDPVTGVVPCEAEMLRWVYDTLIRQRPDGELVPGLAESWESPDPMTFVLHLREGVKFQDGTDFNADAVKQHIERAMTLPTSAISGQLSAISSIETPDASTVVLHLSAARAGILPSVFTDRAGMVPSPAAVAAGGDTYGANGGIGAGPYAYDSHTPAEDMHVSSWEGYWDSAHRHLAGIDMIGAGTEFQTQRIADGEVDYAAMKDVQLPEAEQAKDAGSVDFKLSPTTQYAEIYVNWTVAPFDNLLVRQALEHALDRELLAESLTEGSATPAHSPLSSDSWAHDSSVESLYPYDPAKAKELLTEAGYPDGVTVTVGQIDNPYYTRLSQAIQDMVKESGFTFELETVTGAEINNRLYQLKDLPVAITAFRGTADPGLTLEQKFSSTGNSNPAATTVEGIDELLAEGASSVDRDVRAEAYRQVEQLVMENALSIPIFHNGGLVAYVPELKGVEKGYTTCQFGDFVSADVYFEQG
jgi:peptide/nickel transport system substrate-binding protein